MATAARGLGHLAPGVDLTAACCRPDLYSRRASAQAHTNRERLGHLEGIEGLVAEAAGEVGGS